MILRNQSPGFRLPCKYNIPSPVRARSICHVCCPLIRLSTTPPSARFGTDHPTALPRISSQWSGYRNASTLGQPSEELEQSDEIAKVKQSIARLLAKHNLPSSLPIAAGADHAGRFVGSIQNEGLRYDISTTSTGLSVKAIRGDVPLWTRLLSYNWFRDHCSCSNCVHPSTKQKLHRTGDYYTERPLELESTQMEISTEDGVQGLRIVWPPGHWQTPRSRNSPDPRMTDAHPSFYPASLFGGLRLDANRPVPDTLFHRTFWNRKQLEASPNLHIQYKDFMGDNHSLFSTLMQLKVFGIVIIKGVPTTETTNEACELRKFMNRIGEIRNTFYGETWDVKSVAQSKNIAYTNVDLGFHQDLCYFKDPPRIQALHCLRNRVEGGSSYFADAFYAARQLHSSAPEDFQMLCQTRVPFLYDNDGYYYRHQHHMIEAHQSPGEITIDEVNYSPPFQDTLDENMPRLASSKSNEAVKEAWANIGGEGPNGNDQFAKAIHSFESLLDRKDAQYEFTMAEGDLALFDNRRVLHARREFWDKEGTETQPGEATRWLKGCYMDGDVVENKLRVLAREVFRGEWKPTDDWKVALRARGIHPPER